MTNYIPLRIGDGASVNTLNINIYKYKFDIQQIKSEYVSLNSLSTSDLTSFLAQPSPARESASATRPTWPAEALTPAQIDVTFHLKS